MSGVVLLAAVYVAGVLMHATALVYALRTWANFSDQFCQGGVHRLAKSRMERKFIIIGFGTVCNLLFIGVIPSYLYFTATSSSLALEIVLCFYHALSSVFVLAVHYDAYKDVGLARYENTCGN